MSASIAGKQANLPRGQRADLARKSEDVRNRSSSISASEAAVIETTVDQIEAELAALRQGQRADLAKRRNDPEISGSVITQGDAARRAELYHRRRQRS